METYAKGVKCGVVEWVKRNIFRWLGNIVRVKSEVCGEKRIYVYTS